MKKSYFGYLLRQPFKNENEWFKNNLNIAGYASQDGFIVINPHTKRNLCEIDSVCINEAIRLFMREANITPKIKLTNKQLNFFSGTAYEGNLIEMKKTIISRIIAGDPSAQNFTKAQKEVADTILKMAKKNEI